MSIEKKLERLEGQLLNVQKGLENVKDRIANEKKEPEFKVGDWVYDELNDETPDKLQITGTSKNGFNETIFALSNDKSRHRDYLTKTTAPEPEPINWNALFVPEDGEGFFYIDNFGNINYSGFDSLISIHINCIAIGNCYRTKQEAEHYLNQAKLIQEMLLFINFHDLDWNYVDQSKYYFRYDFEDNQWNFEHRYYNEVMGKFPPCPSLKKAEETYNKFKDRLHYLLPYDGRNEP